MVIILALVCVATILPILITAIMGFRQERQEKK